MPDFDKCNFCTGSGGSCERMDCACHKLYRVDVNKVLDTASRMGISVTDVLNLISACNEYRDED